MTGFIAVRNCLSLLLQLPENNEVTHLMDGHVKMRRMLMHSCLALEERQEHKVNWLSDHGFMSVQTIVIVRCLHDDWRLRRIGGL